VAISDRILIPLVTPFTDDTTTISEVRLARSVQWHINQGAAGFVVGSEAGEFASISLSERKQLLEWVIRDSGALPVYVNVTAMTTASAVDLCQHAARHGARGGVVAPPFVGTFSEAELGGHLTAIRRHGNLPTGYVDPSERTQHLAEQASTTGVLDPVKPLPEEIAYRSAPRPGTYEFFTSDGLALGVGVFGARRATRIVEEWPRVATTVQGLFKLAGPARIGKRVLELAEIEIGGHRGPMASLDANGSQVLEKLLESLS